MGNSAIDTDVLIVCAAPVGLFLVNECARRGLRTRIIRKLRDKKTGNLLTGQNTS